MTDERSVAGAPPGVTFDFEKNSVTSTDGPQQQDQEAQAAESQPPQGVSFDKPGIKLNQAPPAAPPQGVTFDKPGIKLEQPRPVLGSEATGIGPREHTFHNWLQDVQGDVKNGSATTWVGSLLNKVMGGKGTNYGVAPGAMQLNPIAGVAEGLPKVGEGAIEVGQAAVPIARDIASGKSVQTALSTHPKETQQATIGANKVASGSFQALGPLGLIAAPEGEALAVVGPAMVAQHLATKTAEAMGADPDTAELVGNVAAVVGGHQIHSTLHPVLERFGVAVNNRTAAETEYVNRSRNLETARAQAAEVQQRAIEAAGNETNGQGTPAETDQARQLANEAAKNVGDAQKAFDQASKNRADATIELDKLGRKITSVADKAKAAEYERTAPEAKKATDLIKKAMPSKGSARYSDEDLDRALAHTEEAKAGGAKIKDLVDFHNAVEEGRQNIEDNLFEKAAPYKDEPLTTKPEDAPKFKVAQKLAEMAKVDGNFADAMDSLGEFNITDPTVGEAKDMITKLNNYQRSAMKGANNWDVYNMVETKPEFAARFFMLDELRDALHNNLEGHGIENSREARSETASLARVRDAAAAQIRANRGGVAVRGSGSQSAIRSLVAKLVGKAGRVGGAALGAEAGGPGGAVVGTALGDMATEPVSNFIAPRDMTRDEHIEKAMKYKGTTRKPTKITGEGSPAVIPTERIPPAVKSVPESVNLVPRENTDLHADLAAHFGESNLEISTYKELEDQLRADAAAKNRNGVPLDSSEKSLLSRVLKADAADKAAQKVAGEASSVQSIPTASEGPKTVEDITAEADKRAEEGEPTKLNPHLVSLGRGDESALVSHSTAMKAHSPAAEISGLPAGMTSEMAHRHEWAHVALDAVDGPPTGVEIRSDSHPKSQKGAGATSVFDSSAVKDANGVVDPELLKAQLSKWLTQKMAGPANHEVFDGMTKDEAMSHPATKMDLRQARAIVREVHPDFTAGQVEEVVDGAYERARDFISQPHIADRIKANAAVREDGLNETLHASRGRVSQFQKDILEAHNEREGTTDTEPTGGGTGEGSEKAEKPEAEEGKKDAGGSKERGGEGAPESAGESETASREPKLKLKGGINAAGVEASARAASPEEQVQSLRDTNARLKDLLRSGKGTSEERDQAISRMAENNDLIKNLGESKISKSTPPERSTGDVKDDEAIKAGGGVPGGRMQFDENNHVRMFHDPQSGTTLGFSAKEAVTPEAVAEKLRASRAQYAEAEKAKLGESNINKDEKPISEKLVDLYGTTENPHDAGFILNDGRMVPLHSEHDLQISAAMGKFGHPAAGIREQFINDEKAIRTRYRQTRGGKEVVFSIPKEGISGDQIAQIKKSVGQLNGTGSAAMEIADPEGASTRREMAKPEDVDAMLNEIGAKGGEPQQVPVRERVNTQVKDAITASDAAAKAARDEQERQYNKYYTPGGRLNIGESMIAKAADDQIAAHEKDGGSTFTPEGKNLAGEDLYSVGAHPERTLQVDKLTPEVLNKFKEDNADLLSRGDRAVGTWKDPDTGKAVLDITKMHTDRDAAVAEGQALNQKAIYHLGGEGEIPTGGTGEGLMPEAVGTSQIAKGSTVPLMENPLEVKPANKESISTLDITKALNAYSRGKNPALEPGSEPKAMVDRAKKIAEDEAKYQLAQSKTGTEWYTTEMKDHDKELQSIRPELAEGPTVDSPDAPGHPVNLTLFKAAEAILSSGQKPYRNVKSAVKAWDLYKETGEFPPTNPETGKSWGPRHVAAYGNAFDGVNRLIAEKGEKGAADWLLSEHPVSELKKYNENVSGKKDDLATGAMILGEKRGPFMQNLHGIESKFTADMWVSRTWNRWMGTLDLDPRIEDKGKMTSESDAPRNNGERALMKESFEKAANKLGLTTSSMQAVLWYYEQALYRAHGIPVESWSFSDAAKRVGKEAKETPEAEQTGFNFGANEKKAEGGLGNLGSLPVTPSKFVNFKTPVGQK